MESTRKSILFETDDRAIPFTNVSKYKDWLNFVAGAESKTIKQICYFFCSDDRLLEINKKHLNHDYFTDIITFPYAYEEIESDIFISVDRVKDNAINLKQDEKLEMKRVLVHGLLHMCGYDDKTEAEANFMREKESYYISLFD